MYIYTYANVCPHWLASDERYVPVYMYICMIGLTLTLAV